jgi:superfamily II DNA or RNA helicase
MPNPLAIPAVSVTYAQAGTSTRPNALGMRPMQERAYQKRGEQYLLIKSPPASGKSRALMFIALDKLENQQLKQAIIVVPEKSIGASFHVEPKWNLCDAPGNDGGKVGAVQKFLASDAKVLVCTHATFRFAVDKFGVEVLDDRLIAIDEFHHVSANPDNKLGEHVRQLMTQGKTHIVAMTGSYFRGDAEAVLHPDDEAKFDTITYTYYEQLNGYQHLKQLDIGYYFYAGSYTDEIMRVLNPNEKTILHIPNVNSRESTKDKIREVEHIIEELGEWQGTDPQTGFQLVKTADGTILKIADLVDDDSAKREKVAAALKDPTQKNNRDNVDIIIALGMAKEGFDWIWCEHALTIGYRSSLTEIIQIIGRATRDAPGKTRARFTNLIAEPDAAESAVTEAVNDTLKAIAASLLMEQVDDLATGYIYVLRSKSDHPFIAENRSVIHKIGVTGGDVKSRIANAKKDPTYLLADVEIVATFKLANINQKKLEALLHQFFSSARLDLELTDRFGTPVKPREWFFVPLNAIEEVIEKIQDGTIDRFRYDLDTASLTRS